MLIILFLASAQVFAQSYGYGHAVAGEFVPGTLKRVFEASDHQPARVMCELRIKGRAEPIYFFYPEAEPPKLGVEWDKLSGHIFLRLSNELVAVPAPGVARFLKYYRLAELRLVGEGSEKPKKPDP